LQHGFPIACQTAVQDEGWQMKIPFIVLLILAAMLIGLSFIFTVLIPN